jgi:hypothetical protein
MPRAGEPRRLLLRAFHALLFVAAGLVLLCCIAWAVLVIGTGFQDSEGRPRNTGFAGHVSVYSRTLTPGLVVALLSGGGWYPGRKTRARGKRPPG